MKRRHFLQTSSLAALSTQASAKADTPKGKAEHCILIWLGGGMSQVDTFDPLDSKWKCASRFEKQARS